MVTAGVTLKPKNKQDPAASKEKRRGASTGILQKLGPGLITGASDDDPSGIATYSQVGARFGYGLLWTMVITYRSRMQSLQPLRSTLVAMMTRCA
jgi:Mn2+/Fe2+ NRAMP family transporter